MRNLALLILTGLLPFYPCVQAQTPDTLPQRASRLAGSILVGGQAMSYLDTLSDRFGSRLTGSENYDLAAEWAASQFRAAGVSTVRFESFILNETWERGSAQGRMLSPINRLLTVASLGWGPSTPAGGVRGSVVRLTDLSTETIREWAERIDGSLVLLDEESPSGEPWYGLYARQLQAFPLLQAAGAKAILWAGDEANNLIGADSYAFGPVDGGVVAPIPHMVIGKEDAAFVRRCLEKGEVVLVLECQNRVGGPKRVNNVIAEIRGREKPDEWILVGAHLDSWDLGPGTQDNGTGCAMVLEAARALAGLGEPPSRSIRFALWGGEEQGLLGSAAYLTAHASELDDCVAALNTDNGAGRPLGWKVDGRSDVRQALSETTHDLLSGLGGDGLSDDVSFDTDHGPFLLAGLPVLDLWVDMGQYETIHHKPGDTLDKVNRGHLTMGAVVVAITAYALSERSTPVAPRLDRRAVEDTMREEGILPFLKAAGFWN